MDGLLYDIAGVGAREPDCVWLGDAAAAGPPAAPFAPGPFGPATGLPGPFGLWPGGSMPSGRM